MAEDKLNKSLDQLIEENRVQRPIVTRDSRRILNEGRFRGGRSGGRSRGRGVGRGRAEGDSGRFGRKQLTVVVQNTRGGVRKPSNRLGRVASVVPRKFGLENTLNSRRKSSYQRNFVNPKAVQAALEGDGKWQHDLFQDDGPRLVRGTRAYSQGSNPSSGLIVVNNLNFNVSDEDIQELFQRIGALRKFGIKFDRSGRSEGIAEVEFVNFADAEKAMQQYDGVMLDGQRMSIEIVQPRNSIQQNNKGQHIATLRSGIEVVRGQGDGMDMDMD